MKFVDRAKHSLQTDVTWHRTFYLIKRSARALPLATAHYLEDKVPIVGWLPAYDWRWILNDVIAGLTLGIMLIPQSIAYAQIATMPVQYGLMSAWLPATLYAFMGTSKGNTTRRFTRPMLTFRRSLYWPNIPYRTAHSGCRC